MGVLAGVRTIFEEQLLFLDSQQIKMFQFFWLLGSAKPGLKHVKSSARSAAKKTDNGYQGQGCPC